MMKKITYITLFPISILIWTSPAFPLEIESLSGMLYVKDEKTQEWVKIEPPIKEIILDAKDSLMTGENSRVIFRVDGRTFEMGASSIIRVGEIEKNPPLTKEEYFVKQCLSSISLSSDMSSDIGNSKKVFYNVCGIRGRNYSTSDRYLHLKEEEDISIEIKEYNGALDLYRNHLYDNAIRRWLMFIAKNKESLLVDDAQYQIGKTFQLMRRYEEAIWAYKLVISKYPDSLWTAQVKSEIEWLNTKM
jgi:tetratricopeptide (TPR) repeat protein